MHLFLVLFLYLEIVHVQSVRRKSSRTPVRLTEAKPKLALSTPRRGVKTSCTTPSSKSKDRLSVATPRIPMRDKSCKTAKTPLQKARAR